MPRTIRERFVNAGVVMNVSPEVLPDGAYQALINAHSPRQGSISARKGSKRIVSLQGAPTGIFTCGSGSTKRRYVDQGGDLYVFSHDWGQSIRLGSFGASDWTAVDAFTYRSGKDTAIIASDVGAFTHRHGSSTLTRLGIQPPTVAPRVTMGPTRIVLGHDFEGSTANIQAVNCQVGLVDRVRATVIGYKGLGRYEIALSDASKVRVGETVKIDGVPTTVEGIYRDANGTGWIICHLPSPPTVMPGHDNVIDGGISISINEATTAMVTAEITAKDWSLTGIPESGYDSDDLIRIGLMISKPTAVKQIRLQLDVSDVSGSFSDYYEKVLVTNLGMYAIEQELQQLVRERQELVELGVVEPYESWESDYLPPLSKPVYSRILSDYNRQIKQLEKEKANVSQLELPPTAPGESLDAWLEVAISKRAFVKVGSAGRGRANWKSVNSVRLVITTTEAVQVYVSHLTAVADPSYAQAGTGYRYCYVYMDSSTGAVSAPSPANVERFPYEIGNRGATVVVRGSDDQRVTDIAIYREGGSLAGIWKLVGVLKNPGLQDVSLVDLNHDEDIMAAEELGPESYLPVPSSLPVPIRSRILSIQDYPSDSAYKLLAISYDPGLPPIEQYLLPGTPIWVGSGRTRERTNIRLAYTSGGTSYIVCALSNSHSTYSEDPSEIVQADFTVGRPCPLIAISSGYAFMAGDPYNPHILYQSEKEAFDQWPVFDPISGQSYQMAVGSPGNPIVAITDYDGGIVCLNRKSIFVVRLWNGVMQEPIELPYPIGLVGRHAWCKADRTIWFLSDDGIYELAGYTIVKRSEPIDPIFKGTSEVVPPVDWSYASSFRMAYRPHSVFLSYRATDGKDYLLEYELIYRRWLLHSFSHNLSLIHGSPTDRVIYGIKPSGANSTVMELFSGRLDDYDQGSGSGQKIKLTVLTKRFDGGAPDVEKSITGVCLQCKCARTTTVTVRITDEKGSVTTISKSVSPSDSDVWFVPTNPVPLRSAELRIEAETEDEFELLSYQLNFLVSGQVEEDQLDDWDFLGWPFDKKLYEVVLIYETDGAEATVTIDRLYGRNGTERQDAAKQFTVVSPSGTRAVASFPMDGIVAKAVRVRRSGRLKFLKYEFVFDKLPADVVTVTPYYDGGTEGPKYLQELHLEVDTGGRPASVYVETDTDIIGPYQIATTESQRSVTITMPPSVVCRRVRLRAEPSADGKFQLYDHRWILLPADKGPVTHTYDWDDLGWPHDKLLRTITFYYDHKPDDRNIEMKIDTISGPRGTAVSLAAFSFTLTGSSRSIESFSFPSGTVVKAIRVRPAETDKSFKSWRYEVVADKMPPDVVTESQRTYMSNTGLAIVRSVSLWVDTGGTDATVEIIADGNVVHTATVRTTFDNRHVVIALPQNTEGSIWWVRGYPQDGGKFMLFDVKWEAYSMPNWVDSWDSDIQVLGFPGMKLLREIILDFQSSAPVTYYVYSDTGLLKQGTIHTYGERRHVSIKLPIANGTVYNKSHRYRLSIRSSGKFRFFLDGSRALLREMSADHESDYYVHKVWQSMPIG